MHEAIGREMGSVNHCGQCHLFGICWKIGVSAFFPIAARVVTSVKSFFQDIDNWFWWMKLQAVLPLMSLRTYAKRNHGYFRDGGPASIGHLEPPLVTSAMRTMALDKKEVLLAAEDFEWPTKKITSWGSRFYCRAESFWDARDTSR